jgi:hypothetical protein
MWEPPPTAKTVLLGTHPQAQYRVPNPLNELPLPVVGAANAQYPSWVGNRILQTFVGPIPFMPIQYIQDDGIVIRCITSPDDRREIGWCTDPMDTHLPSIDLSFTIRSEHYLPPTSAYEWLRGYVQTCLSGEADCPADLSLMYDALIGYGLGG